MATKRIIQNVVFLDGKTIDSVTNDSVEKGDDWMSKDGEFTGTFKQAVDKSDTIVFESHGSGNEHLNAIYARGKKFGGLDVNTAANEFAVNGANYSLVVNNGKLEIQKFVPLTDVSASGTASWERDSGEQKNVTWTGSCVPSAASGTITQSWTAVAQGGATIGSNSGNTITFTTIPVNATVTYSFSATQNDVTKSKNKSTSWWKRNVAVIISGDSNLSVDGWTNDSQNFTGFKFMIGNTAYTTTAKDGYIPCGETSDGFTYFKTSRNFAVTENQPTYSGYIYILCPDKGASFEKYVTVNNQSVMVKATFSKLGGEIKTYSDGAQTLYRYISNAYFDNVTSIALTD